MSSLIQRVFHTTIQILLYWKQEKNLSLIKIYYYILINMYFCQMSIDNMVNNGLCTLKCLHIQMTEVNNLDLVTFLGIWIVLERTGSQNLLWLMYTP